MKRDVRVNGAPADNTHAIPKHDQPDLSIKVHDALQLFARHYIWFIISFVLCLGFAFYYVQKSPYVYLRYASIMIKDGEQGAVTIAPLRDLGIDMPSQNVTNEIMIIKSTDVAKQVVHRLGLDMEYRREGWLTNPLVYKNDLPVNLQFLNPMDDTTFSCVIQLMPDSVVHISDIKKDDQALDGHFAIKLGKRYSTVLGDITITPTPLYSPDSNERLIVERRSIASAIETLASNIDASLRSRDATIIDIYCTDESALRAEDILDAVVHEYNLRWVNEQNAITESTDKFISERIKTIEKELNEVEETLAQYRSTNLTLNAGAQGEKALYRVEEAEDRLTEIDNQIYMIEYMRSFINDVAHTDSPLPLNTGITSPIIESYLAEYNTVIQKRNSHLSHSSVQNPIVSDLNEKLVTLKSTITQTIENELVRLENEYEKAAERRFNALATVANTPHKTIYLTSIERQKQVKENLYVFLLQKKEENELSQTFTANSCRTVEPPHGPDTPIAPTPGKVYILAFLAGLVIPAFVITLKDVMNTKVKRRKDLASLSIPFLGEIPFDKVCKAKAKRSSSAKINRRWLVVKKNRCDMVNEAFRMLRTNLESILPPVNGAGRVVMVTSVNPGSGKTFIAANLAYSIALTEKRVALLDLDMRKCMISRFMCQPPIGVVDFLRGDVANYFDLMIRLDGLDIMPCGKIPCDPTELLNKETFSNLIDTLKDNYDYVLIDCPSAEIVADAAIINRHVDLILLVMRANLLDRAVLHDIEAWYADGRYRNLAIVLNGISEYDSAFTRHKHEYSPKK